jgi:TolB-like protein
MHVRIGARVAGMIQIPGTGRGLHLLKQRYMLGNWKVEIDASLLCRDKQSIHLEPKVMDVLNYFALHQGELVTREALERDVWRGALVGYDSVTSAVIKLRRALGDDARNPKYIATVPKRGYRLIVPVVQSQSKGRHQPSRKRSISGRNLSILVVPFTNLSDDPEQDFFSEGITEDLITDLSRMVSLRVITSNLELLDNNVQTDPTKIGERFEVDYLLQGSVRRSGGALRVNARLVEAASGVQAWAARYDRQLTEVFSMQDELTGSIVQALALRLVPGE